MSTPGDACFLAQDLGRTFGYRVFPCCADETPATPHGYQDAADDPDSIARLWHYHPGPLIGIATGAASGVDVLDIDAKHPIAMHWWSIASKRIPETRVYRTRSGGLHAYFEHADGVRNSQSKLAKGVDTRGCGG